MSATITIPGKYMGDADATLTVKPECFDNRHTMTLTAADGHVIASAEGFRPGACHDFGDGEDAAFTVDVFAAFLGAACESRRCDFGGEGEGWDVLADDADDWADACWTFAHCEGCGEVRGEGLECEACVGWAA